MTVKRTPEEVQRIIGEDLQSIAGILQEYFKEKTGENIGFALHVFQTTDKGRSQYVSNCDRQEVKAALKELLLRWEQGMPDIPANQVN